MDSPDSPIFDHSTFSGKTYGLVHYVRGLLSKIYSRKFLATLLILAIIAAVIGLVYMEQVADVPAQESTTQELNGNMSIGTISLTGNRLNFVKLSDDFYENLANSTSPIFVINIENAIVDATKFSSSIKKFSSNLTEIHLNNITLTGKFDRVFLPNLREFRLSQVVDAEALEEYQEKAYIKSAFFFDLMENESWEIENIPNLGVNITFKVNGFKFIYVNQNSSSGKRELTIYVPYCNEILQNVRGRYDILSLATCSITKNSIPKHLEYLNFFDVTINDGNISEILQGMTQLQFLFLDLPNSTIDVSHIPKSLSCLSLSTINLTYDQSSTDPVLSNLDTLSLGFNSILDDVYNNFKFLFPNVNQVAAFGFQSANYRLLESCYEAHVFWVLVEEFNRNIATPSDKDFEAMLINSGIASNEVNFVITLPKDSDSLVSFPLTSLQEHDYRFMLLGWYKFLTLEAYRNADKYIIKM